MIPAGATVDLPIGSQEDCILYDRIAIRGDDLGLGTREAPIVSDGTVPDCDAEPVRPSPAPSIALTGLLAAAALAQSRRPRG